nr:inovirus-type Gp2 protein [Escherichia coli]
MTYKYNPFWQQRIRETVRHALNVHSRLTALRVDLRFPDVPAATDAAVISRFINALKARIDAYQKRKHREGKRVHPTTLHYVWAREFGECKGKKHYHLMTLTRNVSIGKVNACIPQPCITSGPGSLGSAKVKNTIT